MPRVLALLIALVASGGCGRSAKEIVPPPVDNAERPVGVALALSPSRAMPGREVMLELHFRIAPGWHIESMEKPSDPPKAELPMTVELHLPEGISPQGDWVVPKPETTYGPDGVTRGYMGEFKFQRRLKIGSQQQAGKLELGCTVAYQVCDNATCLRPSPVELKAELEVDAQ